MERVKIGFAAPFSGDQAIVGVPMRRCAELAVEQANQRGNLPCQISLQGEDDRADPAEAEELADRVHALALRTLTPAEDT